MHDVPAGGHGRGPDPGRLLRGHGRASAARSPTDDLTSALLDGRGRRRPADRRRDHRLPVPDGGGRQRDHHQAAGQRALLGLAQPDAAGQAARRPGPGRRTGSRRRSATTPRARCSPGPSRADVEIHGQVVPAGARLLLLVGSANRDRACLPRSRPLRPRPRHLGQLISFGAAATSAWARTWPGSRPGSRSSEFARRVAGYEIDEAAAERVHSVNVRGFARPVRVLTVDAADAAPDRRPWSPAPRPASAPPPRRCSPPTATRSPSALAARRSASSWRPRSPADGGEAFAAPARRRRRRLGDGLRPGGHRSPGRPRDPGHQRRRGRAAADPRVEPSRLRRARSRSTCWAYTGWSRRSPPAWSSASAATSSSSPPTWSSGPDPNMGAYVAAKHGLEGMAQSHADGARGHRRPRRLVRPGPDLHRAWAWTGTTRRSPRCSTSGPPWGLMRHSGYLQARQTIGNAVAAMARHPPRRPPDPDRSPARGPGRPMKQPPGSRVVPAPATSRNCGVDPIALMRAGPRRVRRRRRLRPGRPPVVLLSGAEANEEFFRAPDEDLDQAGAYPFMTPIFGKGVVFDASPERRREALRNQALRGDMMRGHAADDRRARSTRMVAGWGDEGEIDLLDWFAELTIYTSSACLIGTQVPRRARPPLRRALPRSRARHRRARVRRSLRRRSRASGAATPPGTGWSSWCRRSSTARRGGASRRRREDRDLLDVLMSLSDDDGTPTFTADEITGMFISMMFAGHHTTSGTAAWTLIELLRNPEVLARTSSPSSTSSTPTAGGQLPGAARDPAARGGASRRRCDCTRR